jgi:protease I
MAKPLDGKKIAILATDGVEQSELTEPRKALEEAGANTVLDFAYRRDNSSNEPQGKGQHLEVDLALSVTNPDDYDGLLLPWGVASPDELRANAKAVSFVKRFFDSGKPVAAICHGPRMLVEADVVRGGR